MGGPSESILVVDDRQANLRQLRALLTEEGYDVQVAPDGDTALAAARAAPPDLVLLDTLMPGLDGYTVCERLKADPATAEVPVVFVSAAKEPLDKLRAFSVGGADYLTKPFEEAEVVARVRSHLTASRLRRELCATFGGLEAEVSERTGSLTAANADLREEVARRERTEAALRWSERRFRSLVANIPGAVYRCELGAPWRMNHLTDGIAEITGYPASDFIEGQVRQFGDLILPEDDAEVSRGVQEAVERGRAYTLEYRIRHADGGVRWVYDRGTAAYDEKGEPLWLDGVMQDVTARKLAEEQVERRNRELTSLLRTSEIVLAARSSADAYRAIAEEAGRALGFPQVAIALHVPERDSLALVAAVGCGLGGERPELPVEGTLPGRALRSGKPLAGEALFDRPGGAEVPAPLAASRTVLSVPMVVEDRVFGALVLGHPETITVDDEKKGLARQLANQVAVLIERRRAERALRESEERLALALEGAEAGLWDFWPQSGVVFYSPGWFTMLGYEPDAFPHGYDTWLNLLHPDDRDRADRYVRGFVESGADELAVEFRMRAEGGDWRWIQSRGSVFERDAEGWAERIVGIHTDISELKRNEEEARAGRDLYASLFDQAAVGIARVSVEERWLEVNPRVCDILGYAPGELVGRATREFVLPEDREVRAVHAGRMLRGEVDAAHFEVRFVRKDGEIVWVRVATSLLRDAAGAPAYFIAVIDDVTERKRAGEEREKLQEQLRHSQKMEAVGRLAGGVAHDFNNILTAVIGNAELALGELARAEPEVATLGERLGEILRGSKRAASLTRQLLAFSRRQVTQLKVIDLNRTLGDMERMLRRLLTENVLLVTVPAPNLRSVRADVGQLEQLIVNLVVNARDAMPDGGRVTLETANVTLDEAYVARHPEARAGEHVVLIVRDTGCGMDAETLEHIFEPFFTTKGLGEGTGLGLSTVYGIVRQSDGHVRVESVPGRGSTFRVFLPAVDLPPERPAQARSAEEAPTGTETILVCEDDPSVRLISERFLRQAGYTVFAAGCGEEALELARELGAAIQLLVTDVVMPGMDGRQLAEALRAAQPGLPALFVSGYTADVIAHRGVPESNVEFLEKPFTRLQLLTRVREVLDSHR